MLTDIYHIIKDPVHGSMQFNTEEDSWIKPFIDSENFQRLRHIKQLGMADLIFPGAVHTRFNHCLGCCYVASQISEKLKLSKQEKRIVMIACLLHDIGHGPFSHAFENVCQQKCIRHEDWTLLFLNDYSKQNIPDVETLNIIKQLISGNRKKYSLLADIVSSQLDADRLDYLLRDSHFCGVSYGEYDFRWLLHCLTIIENKGENRLGITRKGIGMIEQYLMARRLMIRNVYLNEKKHGAEFLLSMFLRYLAKAVLEEDLFEVLKENRVIIFLDHLFKFNESITTSSSDTGSGSGTGSIAGSVVPSSRGLTAGSVVPSSRGLTAGSKAKFLSDNFDLYKSLCDYDIYSLIRFVAHQKINHPAVEIAKRLQTRKNPKVINVLPEQVDSVKKKIEQIKRKDKSIKDWQMSLLTLPHMSYEMGSDPILIADYNGKTTFLHEDSLIVRSISDKTENVHALCIDSEIYNEKIRSLIFP